MPVIYLLPCVSITNCKVSFLTFMVVDGIIWNLLPNKDMNQLLNSINSRMRNNLKIILHPE